MLQNSKNFYLQEGFTQVARGPPQINILFVIKNKKNISLNQEIPIMTTEIKKEVYVLSEEEKNQRRAISFLKGCILGYVKGGNYKSTKDYGEEFAKGLEFVKPRKVSGSSGYSYTRRTDA